MKVRSKNKRIKYVVFPFLLIVTLFFSNFQSEVTNCYASKNKIYHEVHNCTENISEDKKTQIVYITKTGNKIHNKGCKYLKKSCIEVEEKEALKNNYDYCKVCYED